VAINRTVTTKAPDAVAATGDQVVAVRVGDVIEQQNFMAENRPTVHLNQTFGQPGWGIGGSEVEAGRLMYTSGSAVRKLTHKYRKNADYPSIVVAIWTQISLAGNTCETRIDVDGVTLHTFSSTSANNGAIQQQTITPSGSGWKTVEIYLRWAVQSGNPVREIRRLRIQDAYPSSYPQPIDP
jgi:hypothetical protein